MLAFLAIGPTLTSSLAVSAESWDPIQPTMDKSLSYCNLGDSCALVVQVLGHVVDDWYECKGISPAQSFRLRSPIDLKAGIHTFYDLVLLSKDPMSLGFGVDTQCFPKRAMSDFEKVAIFDICGGMGGFTLGSACDTLRANFNIPVIHGNVMDIKNVQKLHAMKTEAFAQVTGGFPCQPYSRQGDMQGLRDQRGNVLTAILHSAWLLQADALLLECVDNVTQFADLQSLLDTYAEIAGMHIHKMVFDLQTQCPGMATM